MKTFTPNQITNYCAYEKVRMGGRWNMFFPQARAATGLSESEYSFVMKNFDGLRAVAEKETKK